MLKAAALTHFGGSQIALARALNITKSAVSQWPSLIPLKSALRLQALTKGALYVDMTAYQLPELPRGRRSTRHASA
jgi:transcriptional repressor of cell division inhibition gene dicB